MNESAEDAERMIRMNTYRAGYTPDFSNSRPPMPDECGAVIINPTPSVKVLKRKNGKPTVIEYDGLRFIQEQQPRSRKGNKS